MTAGIDFYFDFSSPYGYFASTRIDALARKYGRVAVWHPILLGVVFKTTGSSPLPQVPLKGEYSWRDFERTAAFHGIDYKRPSAFPLPTTQAARAMLWLQDHRGDKIATAFAKAVFRAFFVDDVNIADAAALMRIATGLGVDGEALDEGARSDAVKDQLKAEISTAMAKGVFGSPFLIVDGEPYWGFDRFDQIEAQLKRTRAAGLHAVPTRDLKEKKPA